LEKLHANRVVHPPHSTFVHQMLRPALYEPLCIDLFEVGQAQQAQQTWTGRGRTPVWVTEAEAKHGGRDALRIATPAPIDETTTAGNDD